MLSSPSDHRRGIESPMDVDRKGPSIFDSLVAAAANAASASASESSTSASTLASTSASASASSTSKSIFGSTSASSFKFEMPKASPSPTLRSAKATLAGLGDSLSTLRFSTGLSESLPRDSGIAHGQEQANQGNGTDPSPCPAPTPKSSLRSPSDDSFDLSTPGSPGSPIELNLDLDGDWDDQDGPSVFDGTPLARPARVARRLSKGFARRFTSSSAAAAAEAGAQLDANELSPATPTRGKTIAHAGPPRSSARTVTQSNVFTHDRSDSNHPPPSPSRLAHPHPTLSTTPHRRHVVDDPHPSTPGTNANHLHMPPPSSSHRPTAGANPRSTPGSHHNTPHRTPGHTPRTGNLNLNVNLNPTLTPRGTPRHKRPRRDYDSDHHSDYASGGDDYDDAASAAGDGSIMYMGERFHGHNHQYMPAPPPMQHTPYGFAHQPHVWVQQPFYPYATPQGVHVHPQVMYGPPPVPPQFGMHGQAQGHQFRRPLQAPHMLHSDDDEVGDQDDGLGDDGGDSSLTLHHSHSHSHSRTARAAPPPAHVAVRHYLLSAKSIVLSCILIGGMVAGAHALYQQFMAGQAAQVTKVQVAMQACARKFQENQCGAVTGRPPMLADSCLEWEQCMARDPYKEVFFFKVAGVVASEFAEGLVGGLSVKTMLFFGGMVMALVIALRASWCCGAPREKERGRSKSRSRNQQPQAHADDDDDELDRGQPEYQGAGRRRQDHAAPGDFMPAGPMTMGGTPVGIMPPPASTARPTHQQQHGYMHQHQQPSPFGTPVYQAGYYQDARTTPGSSGRMGMGGGGAAAGGGYGQRQQQETPSRMPAPGTMRRRRQA